MAQCIEKNDSWARRVTAAAQRGTLGHAIILSGGAEKGPYARFLAAALLCGAQEKPCLTCRDCRKVMEDIHPDVIWVRDGEHKDLSADTVRSMRQDVYIRPNEAQRKVYIFEDCEKLTPLDQNILLKTVEEGPAYAAFIFCADTSRTLLETIRSRCTEYAIAAAEETVDIAEAEELLDLLCRGERTALSAYMVALEQRKLGRQGVQSLLQSAWTVCAEALLRQSGKRTAPGELAPLADKLCRAFSRREMQQLTDILAHYAAECSYNVGEGHLLGALAVEMEGVIK